MRRRMLFLSRILLGFYAFLLASFLWLIVFEARGGGVTYPMAGVSVNAGQTEAIQLPNRIFTCTEFIQDIHCETRLAGRSLLLKLEPERPGSSYMNGCKAFYADRSVRCVPGKGGGYAPMVSNAFEVLDLNLSDVELRSIRRRYWAINALLKIGEPKLTSIAQALSVGAGASAIYLTWRRSSWITWMPAGLIIVWSVVAKLLWFTAWVSGDSTVPLFSLLCGVYRSPLAQIRDAIAVVSIAAFIAQRFRKDSAITKAMLTLGTGVVAATVTFYVLLIALLNGGFVD